MQRYLFESERLGFRRVVKEDEAPIIKLNQSAAVMTYFPAVLSPAESQVYVDKIIAHQEAHGFSKYAVELKETGEFIGLIGLLKIGFQSDIQGEVEIGWRLLSDYWHQGYASEGAASVLDYGFSELAIERIYSFTAVSNQPSEQVMKRLGMTCQGYFNHPNLESDSPLKKHVLYQIEKPQVS